jgi:dephospho-CoA kinase
MVHHLIDQPSSNQRVFVITGMGGCGKTQMVSYFLQEKGSQWVNFYPVVNRMSDEISYKHAIFVDASSSFTVKADLQAWAQSLGDEHEQDVWEDALRVLEAIFTMGTGF